MWREPIYFCFEKYDGDEGMCGSYAYYTLVCIEKQRCDEDYTTVSVDSDCFYSLFSVVLNSFFLSSWQWHSAHIRWCIFLFIIAVGVCSFFHTTILLSPLLSSLSSHTIAKSLYTYVYIRTMINNNNIDLCVCMYVSLWSCVNVGKTDVWMWHIFPFCTGSAPFGREYIAVRETIFLQLSFVIFIEFHTKKN